MKHFHLGAQTGTLVATTVGALLAYRNASPSVVQYIKHFKATLWPVTLPTANAELRLQMRLVAGMNGNFTSGTDVSDITTANYAIRTTFLDVQRATKALQIPVSAAVAGNIMVASTSALNNAGGETTDTQAWTRSGMIFQAAGTAVSQVLPLVIEWKNMAQPLEHEDPFHGCIPISQNTGFLLDLPIALAAGFTASAHFEVDWCE